MSPAFLRQQFQSRFRTLLWFNIGVFLYGLLIVVIFPTISRTAGSQYEQLPEAFKRLAGGVNPFGSLTNYLGVQYFSFTWVIILAAFVMSIARFLGKGVEDGTLEITLASPLERWRVVLSLYIALAIGSVVLVLSTFAGIAVPAAIGGQSLAYLALLKFLLEGFLFLLAISGISLWVSAVSSTGGRTYLVGITFMLGSYLLHFLAISVNRFHFLDYISVFHYYDPTGVLTGSGSIWASVGIFAAIAAATTTLAVIAFERRDLRF